MRFGKTKALISCVVTAQLICGFVFAYVKSWFSHDVAHIIARKNRQEMSPSRENLWSGLLTRSDSNWAVQPQKMARGLKFQIKEVEVFIVLST